MKRRLILTFLIICLVFTAFSCSKAPESVTEQSNSDATENVDSLTIPAPPYPDSYVHKSTDCFTATILDSETLTGKSPFPYEYEYSSTPVLYTVEVKETVRDFSVTKNTKIHVARLVREADEQSEDYFLPFEIGKTYLMCGEVSFYNNKPIILDFGDFSVELKEDGALVPMSLKGREIFKDIKTYDEFLRDEYVVKALKNTINLPNVFYPLLKSEPLAIYRESEEIQAEYRKKEKDIYGVVLSEKEEVQKLIKETMPIDSKKTIDIKTATY
ncbi:MAG: hypothetical protein IJ408_04845 [Clostridia bacterium]|nr:hypothetical protein [Clostridia bacterium]